MINRKPMSIFMSRNNIICPDDHITQYVKIILVLIILIARRLLLSTQEYYDAELRAKLIVTPWFSTLSAASKVARVRSSNK